MDDLHFIRFPSVNNADEDGLLAMGGDLSISTLVSAYVQGIFPWFNQDQPILWWSPDPRMVLYPDQIKISRSLRKSLRKSNYRVSCNHAFNQVVRGCKLRGNETASNQHSDTWITQSMQEAYQTLHQNGYAHSIEVWHGDALVGGLYGVAIGRIFFGESMFSAQANTSKIALVHLALWLQENGFELIDCQVSSQHLISLGACVISRSDFLEHLKSTDINRNTHCFSHGFSEHVFCF